MGVWGIFSILEIAWENGLIDWQTMQISTFAWSHYTISVMELSIPALLSQILFPFLLGGFGI
jgi:hypothetical protein